MFDFWYVTISILVVTGIVGATWWFSTRPSIGPWEEICMRSDKIKELIESAEVWNSIGNPAEADACYFEAQRLNTEIFDIMNG
jgi:hypothetical protein